MTEDKVIKTDEEARQALIKYLQENEKTDEVNSIVAGVLGYHVGVNQQGGIRISNDFYWQYNTDGGEYFVEDNGVVHMEVKSHYASVEEYFCAEHPHLVKCLSNTSSHFWTRVTDNSIPDSELSVTIYTCWDWESRTYQAASALRNGRRLGKVQSPD